MKVKNGKRFECMQASIFPMTDFLPNFPYGKICILCRNPFPRLNLLKIETSPEKLEKRQNRKKGGGSNLEGLKVNQCRAFTSPFGGPKLVKAVWSTSTVCATEVAFSYIFIVGPWWIGTLWKLLRPRMHPTVFKYLTASKYSRNFICLCSFHCHSWPFNSILWPWKYFWRKFYFNFSKRCLFQDFISAKFSYYSTLKRYAIERMCINSEHFIYLHSLKTWMKYSKTEVNSNISFLYF